ncbi:unnamed protein product [Heligmosomoides polygyrus]|uniref:Secreted protein n=1 Tax=Heligmosomoides polygyrus TaxID=6339 RepID=A0A183FXF2_HELPZ|nr:unnamed protein product [Heligmosomoides polygyrus]
MPARHAMLWWLPVSTATAAECPGHDPLQNAEDTAGKWTMTSRPAGGLPALECEWVGLDRGQSEGPRPSADGRASRVSGEQWRHPAMSQ